MRRQLPVYSPLEARSLAKAMLDSARGSGHACGFLAASLARRYACREAILTGSGTQALELAIRLALGPHPGRSAGSVALPAYSCFDVVTAAVGAGAPVWFYDLDPRTLTPDVDGLREALSNGAGAVVVSNLFGFPVDWDGVRASCAEAGAVLIEDAAQGLGSTWKGREGGTFGDLTVLSFGRGKGWTGGGGGGLLVRWGGRGVVDAAVATTGPARLGEGPRAALVTLAQWVLGRPSLYGIPSSLPWLGLGETAYKDPVPLRAIPSFSAALAVATADGSARAVGARRRMAARLRELLERGSPASPIRPSDPSEGGEAGYLRFPILSGPSARPGLLSREARSLGIMQGYPRPLSDLAEASGLRVGPARPFPGAAELSNNLFTLPTHSFVTDRDLEVMSRFLILDPDAHPGSCHGRFRLRPFA